MSVAERIVQLHQQSLAAGKQDESLQVARETLNGAVTILAYHDPVGTRQLLWLMMKAIIIPKSRIPGATL